MLTRGSHRSGRAGLPHPVPQMTTSLRTRTLAPNPDCYPPALRLRGVGVRSLRHVSCRRACHLTPRFPPPGPLGRVPRLQRYYQGATTSCRPSRRTSLPSLGGTMGTLAVSLPWRASVAAVGPGVGHPVSPPGILPWRRQDLPRSWGTFVPMPCSPTPAGPTCQAVTTRRRGPRSDHDEGSHIATFEAQSHSFSTSCLRFAGRVTPTPRKTRFRPPARLYRTGFPPAGFQQKVSNSRHVRYPPLPSFRGARPAM